MVLQSSRLEMIIRLHYMQQIFYHMENRTIFFHMTEYYSVSDRQRRIDYVKNIRAQHLYDYLNMAIQHGTMVVIRITPSPGNFTNAISHHRQRPSVDGTTTAVVGGLSSMVCVT
jgi:hypothetical protein